MRARRGQLGGLSCRGAVQTPTSLATPSFQSFMMFLDVICTLVLPASFPETAPAASSAGLVQEKFMFSSALRLWVCDVGDITEVTQKSVSRSANSLASVPSVVLKSWSQYHVILYKYSSHQGDRFVFRAASEYSFASHTVSVI